MEYQFWPFWSHCYTQLESIRLWYLRFDKSESIREPYSLESKRIVSLLSNRHAGGRFARDLENTVDLDFEGGLKMLSIRVDSIESTRID